MKLRAQVVSVTGETVHRIGIGGVPMPDPAWVEIVEQQGSIYLFRYATSGALLTDTWHESIEQAKRQALLEYGIQQDAWRDIERLS